MPSPVSFTAIFVQGASGDFIVVYVEEYPNVFTQGKTMEQARHRIIEAMTMMIEFARAEAAECIAGKRLLLRETLKTDGADAS